MSELKWFVCWYPKLTGWQVMKDGFRDSWHESEYLANQRRDELNELEDNDEDE